MFVLLLAAVFGNAPARGADVTAAMYQAELGPDFKASDFPKLQSVHELIERYFTAESEARRKEVVEQINASGLSSAVLGRIIRLRSGWGDLTPGVYYVNKKIGTFDVRYFLGIPGQYDRTRSWPLVVMLPAANAF